MPAGNRRRGRRSAGCSRRIHLSESLQALVMLVPRDSESELARGAFGPLRPAGRRSALGGQRGTCIAAPAGAGRRVDASSSATKAVWREAMTMRLSSALVKVTRLWSSCTGGAVGASSGPVGERDARHMPIRQRRGDLPTPERPARPSTCRVSQSCSQNKIKGPNRERFHANLSTTHMNDREPFDRPEPDR